MIKTTILSGTEQKVEFSGNHTHYWVQNLSGGDVFASLSSGITEGADNVLTIPAGGVSYVRDDKGASSVYLLGTGKVQIYGKSNEFCPFKAASGGGDSGGSGSGETNKIESISVNGQTVAPDANKNVNIEIPEMPEDIDAQTVNGHTVESNVPADAVFTDTVINVDNELSDVSENPVQNKVIKAALDAIGGSGENTGVKILHGTVTVTKDDKSIAITFDEAFTETPVVLATIETEYNAGYIHGIYVYNISTSGFTATLTKIKINSSSTFVDGVVHWVALGK